MLQESFPSLSLPFPFLFFFFLPGSLNLNSRDGGSTWLHHVHRRRYFTGGRGNLISFFFWESCPNCDVALCMCVSEWVGRECECASKRVSKCDFETRVEWMNEWMREYAAVRVAGVFSFSFPHSFSRCVRVSYSCSANQCCVRGESILTQYSCELSTW